MSAPVWTATDTTNVPISSVNYSSVNAGQSSNNNPILFWNNFNGSNTISDATNVTITTKTVNGLDTGDTVANGQEVVSGTMLYIQCTSQGDSGYTAVGGPTTAPIGNALSGTVSGAIGGTNAFVNTFIQASNNVSSGSASFLIRLNFSFV